MNLTSTSTEISAFLIAVVATAIALVIDALPFRPFSRGDVTYGEFDLSAQCERYAHWTDGWKSVFWAALVTGAVHSVFRTDWVLVSYLILFTMGAYIAFCKLYATDIAEGQVQAASKVAQCPLVATARKRLFTAYQDHPSVTSTCNTTPPQQLPSKPSWQTALLSVLEKASKFIDRNFPSSVTRSAHTPDSVHDARRDVSDAIRKALNEGPYPHMRTIGLRLFFIAVSAWFAISLVLFMDEINQFLKEHIAEPPRKESAVTQQHQKAVHSHHTDTIKVL